MKAPSLVRKPMLGKFYTYKLSNGLNKGELVEVDFKVEGKEIKYTYTRLKTHFNDVTLTFRNRKG